METLQRTEQRVFRIGDDDFHIELRVEIDHEAKAIEYWIRTYKGQTHFMFANSKPETVRKVVNLILAATTKVTKICKGEGLHIVLLSESESVSSNGAQADTAVAATGGL